jgi:hypothetical protein
MTGLAVTRVCLHPGGTILRLGMIYGEHDPQRRAEEDFTADDRALPPGAPMVQGR